MDRARTPGPRRYRWLGSKRPLRRAILAVAGLAACGGLFDLGRIAAIDLLDGKAVDVEEGQIVQLRARAVTAGGDSVPDATIRWERVDLDNGAVSFTIDSTGVVSAFAPGAGTVVASIEEVRSSPISVTIGARPDVVIPADSLSRTVALGDTVSTPLTVRVLDLTTTPGDSLGLAGRTVEFTLQPPASGGTVALAEPDSAPRGDPAFLAVASDPTGVAAAVVLRGGTSLDSAVVDAVGRTADGGLVAGSPVRFTVYFAQN